MQVPAQATVGVGIRFLALLIDAVVVLLVMCPFIIVAAAVGDTDATGTSGADLLLNCVSFIVGTGYYIVMEALRGATIGKMALGLRVVNLDGTPIDWQESIIRNVLRVVDAFPYFIPYLVGSILIWTSPTKQRLGDKLAETVVVKKDRIDAAGSPTARF